MEINKNYGVLIADPLATDYIAGVNSPLGVTVINDTGDMRPYKPDEEWQTGGGGDKMDCVTVSSAGCIETVLMLMIRKQIISVRALEFLTKWKFIDANGFVKISTRWAAIQNGTTQNGNYLNAVGQWWHEHGIIPEWMLPNDQSLNWQQFYNTSVITDQMRQCAAESLEVFNFNYEWVYGDDNTLRSALKRGAVQIATAVCAGWNDKKPVPACNQVVQHATELLFVEANGNKDIFDSYNPFNKTLSNDYPIPYRMLYVVAEKENKMIELVNSKGTIYMVANGKPVYGFATMDVVQPFLDAGVAVVERDLGNVTGTFTVAPGYIMHKQ